MRIPHDNPWLKAGFIVLLVITVIVLTGAIIGFIKSYQTNKQADNDRFQQGNYPSVELNGTYKGSWMGNQTTWQGKEFFADSSMGINNFADGQRYEFKTYKAKSLSSNKEVLRIDYNVAGNPFWIRHIIDELTETEPGKYQGKIYVKYLFGITFSLSYFTLEK